MYQIGEKVIYGIHGVCMVADQEDRVVDRKKITYLVLEPVKQDGSRYLVPTHNAAAMAKLRPMLTQEALVEMMESPEIREDHWIPEENMRKQTYRDLMANGDRVRLMQMVRALYRHKAVQAAAGKKCHLCDDNFLRDAERLLAGEVALVMELPPEEAKVFLREKLKAGI